MNAIRNKRGRFKVGDWVAFPYGTRNLVAQVVEAVRGRLRPQIPVARQVAI